MKSTKRDDWTNFFHCDNAVNLRDGHQVWNSFNLRRHSPLWTVMLSDIRQSKNSWAGQPPNDEKPLDWITTQWLRDHQIFTSLGSNDATPWPIGVSNKQDILFEKGPRIKCPREPAQGQQTSKSGNKKGRTQQTLMDFGASLFRCQKGGGSFYMIRGKYLNLIPSTYGKVPPVGTWK